MGQFHSLAGVHETYQFVPLKGQANFVVSLIEAVTGLSPRRAAATLRSEGGQEPPAQPKNIQNASLLSGGDVLGH